MSCSAEVLRKLKAVDQSRQEFVSNVSHELKHRLRPFGTGRFPYGNGRGASGTVPGVYG